MGAEHRLGIGMGLEIGIGLHLAKQDWAGQGQGWATGRDRQGAALDKRAYLNWSRFKGPDWGRGWAGQGTRLGKGLCWLWWARDYARLR